METAPSIHSAEKLNFLRLVDLLIRLGPQAIRHVFDQEFPPSNLSTDLAAKEKKHKIKLLKDTKRVITNAQWNLLYPTDPNTVESKDFDITLMVCLLRNLAGYNIYDQDPMAYVYDTSKDANISRIKFYRNKIVHSENGEMEQQNFTDIWNCVSGATLCLAAHLKPHVDALAHSPIDADILVLLKQHELEQELTRNQILDYENKLDALSTKNEATRKQLIDYENKLELLSTKNEATRKQLIDYENKLDLLSTEKANDKVERHNIIRKWKKDDIFYKATTATKYILDTLTTDRGVIVTGPPGCGKSAAAHHVALVLESQHYELYPIESPEDIRKVFCKNTQQVFIIDDICGKFAFDQPLSKAWEKVEKYLENLLADERTTESHNVKQLILESTAVESQTLAIKDISNTEHQKIDESKSTFAMFRFKVIATCREYIYTNNEFPDFKYFDFKQCSFTQQYKLSDAELRTIAASYLEETTLEGIADINLFDFFPLLCSLYKQVKDMRLFTHPVEWIDSEINGLKKNSLSSFIALALLVLYNNYLKKEDLKSIDLDNLIGDICKECNIEQAFSKKPDEITFNKLIDIFISETEDGFTAVHDTMFDIISISVSSFIMNVILKSAPTDFIKSRMQFKNLGECEISNVIYIPEGYEEEYMDRINREIKNGNYWPVFDNLNTKKEQFREKLSKYLDQNFASTEKSFPTNSNKITPLHVVASLGYLDLVEYFACKHPYQLEKTDLNGQTPYLNACEKGKMDVVRYLHGFVDRYPKMLRKPADGSSALHLAASTDNAKDVTMADFGINLNKTNIENSAAFYPASENGHYNTVTRLQDLNEGIKDSHVDTWIKDKHGSTALHDACSKGHTEIITLLVNYGMNVNDGDIFNQTPLHEACANGHYNAAKLLLDLNEDIKDSRVDTKIKDMNGATALHYACFKGQTKIVTLLVDYGMDVNDVDYENETPFYLACFHGYYNIVKLLLDLNGNNKDSRVDTRIKEKGGWTALHVACYKGISEIVALLVNYGMDVNDVDNENRTPFLLACHNGDYNTVKLLLDLNGGVKDSCVDTRIKDTVGSTGLHGACFLGYTDIVVLLVNYGMNVNDINKKNQTPFVLACGNGHYNTAKTLLEFNEDITDSRVDTSMKDEDGWTALHAACYYGQQQIVTLLVNYGMGINDIDNSNQTPFFLASLNGQYNTVKLLLELNEDVKDSRVDTRIKDKDGWTALHAACSNGHTQIITLLVNYGMNVNDINNENQTPFRLACRHGHTDAAKLLLGLNTEVIYSRTDTRM